MIDSKTTIVKKQVGLSKNGKVKERKSSSRTRPVVNRNRASSRTKPRNEARDGSPAVREQPEKGKKGRKKNRRTTVRAPLPTHYVKGMSKSREIDAQIDDEDDVVDLEEVEVDNERPSQDGLDPQEDENVDADVDADAKETEETHDKEIIEDNFDERGLEDEAACTANANTFQTALKSVDAAFYALGKFVGQNTCHTASLDSKVQLVEGKKAVNPIPINYLLVIRKNPIHTFLPAHFCVQKRYKQVRLLLQEMGNKCQLMSRPLI
jgi:hypothetical protein